MKMCKNSNFRHISGIFGQKKVYLTNWTWPYFGHCYYAFLNKESVKTNDEILRKCQKTGFPAYFRYFRPEKFFFRKSGSVTFWRLPLCILLPKISKN